MARSVERIADAVEALVQDGERLDRLERAFHVIAKSHARIAAVLDESAATGNVHITIHQAEGERWQTFDESRES